MRKKSLLITDRMQKNYRYELVAPTGKHFDPMFRPELTPKEMLGMGVFGGKYMNDCQKEFPKSWFTKAKLSPEKSNPKLNYFKVKASQPLSVWRKNSWINEKHDPRGWFQWYCRYYMGRRLPDEDRRQIKRWYNMRRHALAVFNNCKRGDLECRPRQRQALLHWAYDSTKI